VNRQVCVVLHDVAPATWPLCARLLDWLDELGAPPVTLLVVPDFHARGRVDATPEFVRAIEARLRRGDELALHGYHHRDAAPAPRDPVDWLLRRVLTAGEGEFAALSALQARRKLRDGLDTFAQLGWPVSGFVPPAWLASAGTRGALKDSGLQYTSTHAALIALPDGRRFAAPCLTASPRSSWRRVASRLWLRAAVATTSGVGTVRVGLHPGDVLHDDLMTCWRSVLTHLLMLREPVTKFRALAALSRSESRHA
jgi:predicted deacetylase